MLYNTNTVQRNKFCDREKKISHLENMREENYSDMLYICNDYHVDLFAFNIQNT